MRSHEFVKGGMAVPTLVGKGGRLESLDALRGFDMFFIMGGGPLILAICAALIATLLPQAWQATGTSLAYVAVCWLFLCVLYRKNVFLKV